MARPPRSHRCIYALLALAPCALATPTPVLQGRGGGSNPVTDDPATIPTTPPTSNYQNGVPKIGGSEGGFIGLVVGLGVLVILGSLAVWFFLKRRRQRRAKRRSDAPGSAAGATGGLGASYDAKTSFPKPGSGGLFGGKNAKKGWVRTGEGLGDGMGAGGDDGIELSGGRKGQGPYLSSNSSGAFSSASTIRLAPPDQYTNPYSPNPSAENLVSPVGQPSPALEQGDSAGQYEQVAGGQTDGGQERGSPTSGRGRFAGGTRFRESL